MSARAYYNEYDPKAAAWLRELIKAGLIAPGDVDTRDIQDIQPHELAGYTQQHFFAGIGGWSLALRLAGWPDDRAVRTGSCPCQPFSAAGKQLGTSDERHLWPVFRDLITFGEPTATFGEQVASKLGREWLAGVRTDLEALGYAVGAADLCAAGVAAPQLRQRIYWVADPHGKRFSRRAEQNLRSVESQQQASRRGDARGRSVAPRMADSASDGRGQGTTDGRGSVSGGAPADLRARSADDGCASRVGDAYDEGPQGWRVDRVGAGKWSAWSASVGVCGNDGIWRRVVPGIPPLAPRLPGRVALIRGSGNAIVPELAAEFVIACRESGLN